MSLCPKCRVLVAEDSPLVLRLLLRMFDGPRFHVTAREDGIAALEVIEREGPIDLLVSDIDMPGISGVKLARHLCCPDCWVPAILITGCVPEDVDVTDLPPNVAALIQKPFGIDTIIELADRIHCARACRAPLSTAAAFGRLA